VAYIQLVADPWDDRWVRVKGSGRTGGQGASFLASPRAGDGPVVFVKTLLRPRDMRARKRFAREVAAYETLSNPGIPRLVAHNRDDWRDPSIDLYLVLEAIQGPTLGEAVASDGPLELAKALAMCQMLTEVIDACHSEGLVHRDIKPANVILRGGDPARPVLVDFGLSFNSSDDDLDPTRIGEEIGNRFLRLPEHATGGREPGADVAQLAGLFLFALTAVEPRVLIDGNGQLPHQRAAAAEMIGRQVAGRARMRLQSVFDRAFATRVADRFSTAGDLLVALQVALAEDVDGPEYEQVMAQLAEFGRQPHVVAEAAAQQRLREVQARVTAIVQEVARRQGFTASQTGATAERGPWPVSAVKLAIVSSGQNTADFAWTAYTFELRGADEITVSGEDVLWRGTDLEDPALVRAVELRASFAFLEAQRGEEPSSAVAPADHQRPRTAELRVDGATLGLVAVTVDADIDPFAATPGQWRGSIRGLDDTLVDLFGVTADAESIELILPNGDTQRARPRGAIDGGATLMVEVLGEPPPT